LNIWHLCIIEKNGKYYTGITTNLKNRLHQHGNPPLLYEESFPDKFKAAAREKQINCYSRQKKEALFTKLNKYCSLEDFNHYLGPVPVPSAILLSIIGLGYSGLRLRRKNI